MASIIVEQVCALKTEKRPYRLGKRADQQAETRRRIVEAAVELHGTLGPAHTSLSQIAERAGVQRHTLYAHFPDERSVALACSALFIERNPLPGIAPWREMAAKPRLKAGLAALYDWYRRTEGINACVLRDAEHHEITREVAALRVGPPMAEYREALGDGLTPDQQSMLGLMMSFYSWRSLARDEGLDAAAAVALAVRAIVSAG
jgi:AcrR family transcriptional regulator